MSGAEQEFKVSDKQLNEAQHIFNLFDKKGDGTINTKEIGQIFKGLGLHADGERLKFWADEADEEAVGFITWEQFKVVFEMKIHEDFEEKELREAFRVLAKGHNNQIAVETLRWILASLSDDTTEEEIEEMINQTDTDGSGAVDYEEFKNLMCGE